MSSPKIITVYGATGSQGGSVVASLLQSKTGAFLVRGITRNTVSDKSRALAKQGVEMLQADGLSKQQMVAALKGSWGLFVNTNSDDPVSKNERHVTNCNDANHITKTIGEEGLPSETDVGKIIIDAAAEAGVQHVVYSGMESAAEITEGAIPNAAFDGTRHIRRSSLVFTSSNLF
jgi:nucleoside-diphosphate-sugar epimerase